MTLGQEIRYYRKKKGLTQTEFGALFGMSKQAVYSWETGLYSPDISVLLRMADFFQIPICILVGRPGMFSVRMIRNTNRTVSTALRFPKRTAASSGRSTPCRNRSSKPSKRC